MAAEWTSEEWASLDHLSDDRLDQGRADEWIDKVWDMADDSQQRQIVDAFLGSARFYMEPEPAPQKGGGINDIDYRMYRLLELADSIHDIDDAATWADVMTDIGAELPWAGIPVDKDSIPEDKRWRVPDFRLKKMLLTDVASFDRCKLVLTTNPTLKFARTKEDVEAGLPEYILTNRDGTKTPLTEVRNDMFDRDFTKGAFKVSGDDVAAEFETYLKTVEPARPHVARATLKTPKVVDIWSFEQDDARQVYKLTQLAFLCSHMRDAYGNRATFVVDSNDTMLNIVLGIRMSYSRLETKVLLYVDSDAHGLLPPAEKRLGLAVADAKTAQARAGRIPNRGSFAQSIVESSLAAMKTEVDVDWTIRSCDASFMDSAERYAPLHDKATGEIFHKQSAVQILLKGATSSDTERTYSYHIVSNASCMENSPVDATEATKVIRTSATVTGRPVWRDKTGAVADHSRAHANSKVKTSHDLRKSYPQAAASIPRFVNTAAPLAMKRAGDWGMIQHCKEHGMVFVTPDKFAALYAVFRDVAVLYFNVNTVVSLGLLQYSVSLVASDAARTSLRHYPDEKPSQSQFYGGGDKWRMACVLSAVVVACAVLG